VPETDVPDIDVPEIEMSIQLHPRRVQVHDGLIPLMARDLSLAATTDALTAAGLDHFAVRGLDDRTPVVGLRVSDRPAALAALAALGRARPGYVGAIQPKPLVRDLLLPAEAADTWKKLATATVLRLIWFYTEPTRSLVLGREYGCDIEFWTDDERRLVAPRPNRVMKVLPAGGQNIDVPAERFTRLRTGAGPAARTVRTRPEMAEPLPDEITFPIDAVFTWVDGQDPEWQRRRAEIKGESYHPESASAARFINRDEMRYSLRSLHANAPWFRNIYIVTDDQVPSWLDTSVPNVQVVSHKEIFSDPSVLPVYNSHAIESQLHHIDGLAEHFVYFNDDMFIGRPLAPQAFFLANGLARFFFSQSRVPMGPISIEDTPVDAAHKNNRRLLNQRFGVTTTQVFQHVPYALRRSVMAELEEAFPADYAATMAARFRGLTDLSTVSNLAHYYGFHTGRALPGSIRYGYVQLAVPDLAQRLARALVRRDWDAFCLNDAFSTEAELVAQHSVLQPFLDSYFPVPSPYEKR
jgi:hypothetical protein